MNLEELQKIVKDDFLKTYFYRYFEFEKETVKKGGRTFYRKTSVLNSEVTDQRFIETFGSYDNLFQDIRLFSRTVKDEKLDPKAIIELGEKYIASFPDFHDETKAGLFLNADKASRSINQVTKKKTYEYDIRSAWSSCLVGNVPISSKLLPLSSNEKKELFLDCMKPKFRSNNYLFCIAAEIEKNTAHSIHTSNQCFYLWGFEVEHFLKTNLLSSLSVVDVFGITYGVLPGVDLFLNKLYTKKESSKGLLEYNYWKSHMNYFNRLVFDKSALIENFVVAKTRARIYEAINNQDGIISINLDSITSSKKLTHLKFSERMGGWREVDKHKRNFSSADRIAKYDLKKGIFNEKEI